MIGRYIQRRPRQVASYEEYQYSYESISDPGSISGYQYYSFSSSTGTFSTSGGYTTYTATSGKSNSPLYTLLSSTRLLQQMYDPASDVSRIEYRSRSTTTTEYDIVTYDFSGDTATYGTNTSGNGQPVSGNYYLYLGPRYTDTLPSAGALGIQPLGCIVKIMENGSSTDFVVAAHNYPVDGCTYLFRRLTYSNRSLHGSAIYNYTGSDTDAWLNGTYLGYLDADMQAVIPTAPITGGTYTAQETIYRKVFLLSAQEMGLTGKYTSGGTALSLFTSAAERVAGASASQTEQWLRSIINTSGSTYRIAYINNAGAAANNTPTGSRGIRPALCLPSSFTVDASGNISAAAPRPMSANIGGVWNETDVYQNVGGIWTPSTDQKANIAGIWR